MSLAVAATNLTFGFGAAWILRRLSLRLAVGETLLLSGSNGVGKTTLLQILATARRPAWGTLSLFGQNALYDPQAVRQQVALLSHAHGMYEALSAAQNLRVVARLVRPVALPRLATLLDEVGLQRVGDRPLRDFSAGMRRRLAVARLRLLDPPLLLLDEPLAQLDAAGTQMMVDLCAAWRRAGRTQIICSHDVERPASLCDRHLRLSAGGLHDAVPDGSSR